MNPSKKSIPCLRTRYFDAISNSTSQGLEGKRIKRKQGLHILFNRGWRLTYEDLLLGLASGGL